MRVPPAHRAHCVLQVSWVVRHASENIAPGLETERHGALRRCMRVRPRGCSRAHTPRCTARTARRHPQWSQWQRAKRTLCTAQPPQCAMCGVCDVRSEGRARGCGVCVCVFAGTSGVAEFLFQGTFAPPPPPEGCIRKEGSPVAAPEAVRQAVGGGCRSGGGCCRLQMPLNLALAVRETAAGQRLGALERGGGHPPPLPMHPCPPPSQHLQCWRRTRPVTTTGCRTPLPPPPASHCTALHAPGCWGTCQRVCVGVQRSGGVRAVLGLRPRDVWSVGRKGLCGNAVGAVRAHAVRRPRPHIWSGPFTPARPRPLDQQWGPEIKEWRYRGKRGGGE